MHNVEWKVEGDKLIVTIDISKESVEEAPASASGKTYLVASTGSAMPLPSKHAKSMTLALNLMAKK
jgi:hypothetical protein